MAFVKRDVKDRVVEHPRRYRLIQVEPGIFDLEPITGEVIELGTPINKAYLQPIEEAIEDIEDGTTVIQNAYSANNAVISDRATKLATPRNINGVPFDGTQPITIVDNTKAPTNHASTGTTYGVGNASNYGHVKLSDSTGSTSGVSGGTAATPAAVKVVKDMIDSKEPVLLGTIPLTNLSNLSLNVADFFSGNYDIFIITAAGSLNLINTYTGVNRVYAIGLSNVNENVNDMINLLQVVLPSNGSIQLTLSETNCVSVMNSSGFSASNERAGRVIFGVRSAGTIESIVLDDSVFLRMFNDRNQVTVIGSLSVKIYGVKLR